MTTNGGSTTPLPAPHRSGLAWGEVEGNEHWQFCLQIAQEIINAAQAYAR
jgi:hypothetical protein